MDDSVILFSWHFWCVRVRMDELCSQVKVVTSVEDQKRILHSCHSDPTSGNFGVTKTWRRLAERFYWKGMYQDAKNLVRFRGCGNKYLYFNVNMAHTHFIHLIR